MEQKNYKLWKFIFLIFILTFTQIRVNAQAYCSGNSNPFIVIPRMVSGNQPGAPTLQRFPLSYTAEQDGNPIGGFTQFWNIDDATNAPYPNPAGVTLATNAQIGTVYGEAWDEHTKKLYVSAYNKRKTRFGPNGTGAIYVIGNADAASPQAPALYVDLNTIFGSNTAGVNPHPTSSTDWLDDDGSKDDVGKISIGDIDMSKDMSKIFAVNMADKKFYIVPTSGALNATTIKRINIPTLVPGFTASDIRPFGIGVNDYGTVFVGAVASGASTGNAADVAFIVWRLDGDVFTRVFTETAHSIYGANGYDGFTQRWNAWDDNTDEINSKTQPMLSDIEFVNGKMVLGIRDRYGDMVPDAFKGPNESPFPRGYGDIINLIPGGSLGFISEPNAKSFFDDKAGDGSQESGNGSLAVTPTGLLIMTAYDAVNSQNDGTPITDNYQAGGVQVYNPISGFQTGAYDLYHGNSAIPNGGASTSNDFDFGKANGLGDVELLCEAAPIEAFNIGNVVFIDIDNSGAYNTGDLVVDDVIVEIYNASNNTLITKQTTQNGGRYLFTDLPAGSYYIVVAPSNFIQGGPLFNKVSVTGVESSTNLDDNSGENGIDNASPATNGIRSGIITLAAGSPLPTDNNTETGLYADSDNSLTGNTTQWGDDNTNLTIDFGFKNQSKSSLGSTIFKDNNNNGVQDAGELGIEGASVQLYNEAGTAIGTPIITNATGNYQFTNLDSGKYKVGVTPPTTGPDVAFTTSSQDISSTTMPDNNIDGDDNGIQTGPNLEALSNLIELTPEAEPTEVSNADIGGEEQDDADETNGNMTVDFGFYTPLSIGSTVFIDANNNGTQDGTEAGIPTVMVTLYAANGTTVIATDETDATGNYFFGGLAPGDYRVGIATANIPAAYPTSSTDIATSGADNATDLDDNGAQTAGSGTAVISPIISLASGDDSTSESTTTDPTGGAQDTASGDANGNMTVDFGFYKPVNVSGNVFIDSDGITSVNGEPYPAAANSLYAILVDATNKVAGSAPIGSDGKFEIVNVASGSYTSLLSTTTPGEKGTTAPTTASIPLTYYSIAEGIGTVPDALGVGNSIIATPIMVTDFDIQNINFGINTQSPLPVNLINFSGKQLNEHVHLTWKTANEKDFSHFEVQKSNNAKEFGSMSTVKSKQTGIYNLVDYFPTEGVNYYRLKMVDLDGTTSFSKTVNINFEKNSSFVSVENPAHNKEILVFTNLDKPEFSLFTSLGYKADISIINQINNRFVIKIKNNSAGIYYLNIVSNEKSITKKVLIP